MGSRPLLGMDGDRGKLPGGGLTRNTERISSQLPECAVPGGDRRSDTVEALRLPSSPQLDRGVADEHGAIPAVLGCLLGASAAWSRHKPPLAFAFGVREFSDIAILDKWFSDIYKLSKMNDRIGRRSAQDDRRTKAHLLRLTALENAEVKAASTFEGVALAAWARRVVLRAARAVNRGAW